MKASLFATLFVLSLLLFADSGAVFAQTVAIGVLPGNTFEYSYTFSWESTNPVAIMPDEFNELKNTQVVEITVKSVSGSVINLDVTKRFMNGSESTQNGDVDLDQQIIGAPYGFLIIRANANPREKIYPSGGSATINDTVTKSYPVGPIETVHYISIDSLKTSYEKAEIFFDKSTGAAVEFRYENRETSGSYSVTTKESLILQSSNVGGRTDYLMYAIILLITGSIIVVLFFVWNRKKSKQKSV